MTIATTAVPNGVPPPVPQLWKVEELPVALIDPSEANPRKTIDEKKLEDLANSMKTKGLELPILVRAKAKGRYELVYGERRWRSAKKLGWEVIPARVRTLTDSEALEAALIENGQRVDVDEYEEAEAFRQLRDKYKYSVEQIVAKVGKTASVVYNRLKLAELDGKARELAQKHELPASHALLASRIVGAERQREAVAAIVRDGLSFREAQDFITREYMLELKDAPFDVTDSALVPAAGSCTKCPKRTGNQGALFADIKSKDICTDAKCFKSKEDAVYALRVEKAKAAGQQVLSENEGKNLFDQYGHLAHDSKFKRLDGEEWVGDSRKTVKQILGKDAPPSVLARDKAGRIVELVPRAPVEKKIAEARKKADAKEDARKPTKENQEWKREQKKREAERERWKKARIELVAAAQKKELGTVALRGLVMLLSAVDDHATVELRKWDDKDGATAQIVFSKVVNMGEGELRGLLVDLAVDSAQFSGSDNAKDALAMLSVGLGIHDGNAPKKKSAKAAAKPAGTVKRLPPKAKSKASKAKR